MRTFPTLFGQFNASVQYRKVAETYTEDLSKPVSNVLYTVICLSSISSGLVVNPETGSGADARTIYLYCAEDIDTFNEAMNSLRQHNILQHVSSKNHEAYTLHNAILYAAQRAQQSCNYPALIVNKNYTREQRSKDRQAYKSSNPNAGYVYIIASDSGLFKIGKSKDPDQRLKGIATSSAHNLTLLHTIYCDDMGIAEAELHHRYRNCRQSGEWFKLTDKDVSRIMKTKRMNTRK
jgi:hypothetical protein